MFALVQEGVPRPGGERKKKKIFCKLKASSFGMWVEKWEGKVQKTFCSQRLFFFLDVM